LKKSVEFYLEAKINQDELKNEGIGRKRTSKEEKK